MREAFIPRKPAAFWCNHCDAAIVDSDKPESGSFFVQFGHCFDSKTGQYDGNYVGVMYSLCPDCQK